MEFMNNKNDLALESLLRLIETEHKLILCKDKQDLAILVLCQMESERFLIVYNLN